VDAGVVAAGGLNARVASAADPAAGTTLEQLIVAAAGRLQGQHSAREAGLVACRTVIKASSSAIRAVHLRRPDTVAERLPEAEAALTAAREALAPHPAVYHAGFLHDAAKEYVEARATQALVAGLPVPSADDLEVEAPAWLNGLAEAASELRRHALDRLRDDRLDVAEALLARMDEVFGGLVAIDLPDAITGGLRRTLDSLRAVIERTRGDITIAVLQSRLQRALDRAVD
jgi:translin